MAETSCCTHCGRPAQWLHQGLCPPCYVYPWRSGGEDAAQALERGLPDSRGDAVSRAALDASIAQYNRLRTQAQQVQHYLIIHREAMGFWNHDDVFRCYPIPAALTPPSPAHTPKPPEHP